MEMSTPPSIMSQQIQIEQAIQVGVPLYNSGNIEGCAQTYKEVLLSIQEKEQSVWIQELSYRLLPIMMHKLGGFVICPTSL